MKKLYYGSVILFLAGMGFCFYRIDYVKGFMAEENFPFIVGIFGAVLGLILAIIFLKATSLQSNLTQKQVSAE